MAVAAGVGEAREQARLRPTRARNSARARVALTVRTSGQPMVQSGYRDLGHDDLDIDRSTSEGSS
jgi:hypothetical protein